MGTGPMRWDTLPSRSDIQRAKAIKAAGKGMENSLDLSDLTMDIPAACDAETFFIADDEPKRKVLHIPNPINFQKWALKKYNRMCDAAEAEGLDVPSWPFDISQKELQRRVDLQKKRIASDKIRAAQHQAKLVDAGEKTAANSKQYDAYVPAPLVRKGNGCIIRRDPITTLELQRRVDVDIEEMEVERIVR